MSGTYEEDRECMVCGKKGRGVCAVHEDIPGGFSTPVRLQDASGVIGPPVIVDAGGVRIATMTSGVVADHVVRLINNAGHAFTPPPRADDPLPAPPVASNLGARVGAIMNDSGAAWIVDTASPQVRAVLGYIVAKAEAHDAIRASRDAMQEEAAAHADLADMARAEVALLRQQLERTRTERDEARRDVGEIVAKLRAITEPF